MITAPKNNLSRAYFANPTRYYDGANQQMVENNIDAARGYVLELVGDYLTAYHRENEEHVVWIPLGNVTSLEAFDYKEMKSRVELPKR